MLRMIKCAPFLLLHADINECTAGSHNCDTNAFCTNTVGSFSCACNAGYTGDGAICKRIPTSTL